MFAVLCNGLETPLFLLDFAWKMGNKCSDLLKPSNIQGDKVYIKQKQRNCLRQAFCNFFKYFLGIIIQASWRTFQTSSRAVFSCVLSQDDPKLLQ